MTPKLDQDIEKLIYRLRCSYCSLRTDVEVDAWPDTPSKIIFLARSLDWATTMDRVNNRALVFCSECCETRQKFKRLRSISKLLILTKRTT